MSDQEIIDLLREALLFADDKYGDVLGQVEIDATLSQLGIDSIDALKIAAYVEDKLQVQFPDNELSSLVDVRGFVNLTRHVVPQVVEANPS
jgi:acyl carrier protein